MIFAFTCFFGDLILSWNNLMENISYETIWGLAVSRLRSQNEDVYQMWFSKITPIAVDGDTVTFSTPDSFFFVFIVNSYGDFLEESLKNIEGKDYSFVLFPIWNKVEQSNKVFEYAIDFVAKQNEKTKEKIDQYIKSNYYVIAANDKNGNDTANLISKNVKFNCLYGFVKGIILAQYTNEMKIEYNNTGGITLKLNGKIFATLLNDLLLEYGFTTLYDEYTTPTVLFIQERYGFLKDCINLQSGFCNESEPDIFISSPARDIREPLSGK